MEHAVPYTEGDLVGDFMKLAPRLFDNRRHSIAAVRELPAGRNVADVVLLITPRLATVPQVDPISVFEAVVLASLRKLGSTRIDLLEEALSLPHGELRSGRLSRVEDWGLVQRGSGGQIRLGRRWNKSFQLVAVEAKLDKWRRALTQASSYSRYADLAYVVLPKDVTSRALANESEFRQLGVGLLSVEGRREIKVHIKPVRQAFHDWQRDFILSRMLAAGCSQL